VTKRGFAWAFFLILFTAAGAYAAQSDAAGCKDHPLFPTRMPAYRIADCKVQEFGLYEFRALKGPKTPVEGKFTFITYRFTGPAASEPSPVAVVRNYENAIQKAGGTILQSMPNYWVNGKIVQDGREVWVEAERGNGTIWLRIVEKQAMTQYVEADAAAFANDINTMGHASVYGIHFDTGKSEIKPESAQAIAEIAKLLTNDPGLKLQVVGHTDNVGTREANLKLSLARAQAVVLALTAQHGIAAARLEPYGCGSYAPVASNKTEEGRAKNRRVELVAQ
jgi:OOP family OmpA-OmpF porin